MDDGTKQFLWKAIIGIPDVEFFALTEPLSHIFGTEHGEGAKKESASHEPQNPLDQVLTCTVMYNACTRTVI